MATAVMAAASESDLKILDKILLNNEIVHLRSTANNAKINVIRKLTREIKKLKVEKSDLSEDDQLKRKTRAEKLIEQIQIIKTINKDDISTAALIYRPKESLELLQNPIASMRDKLVAKIARNKVIAAGVAKMLAKYKRIKHRKLEAMVSSIGVKKRKRLGLPAQQPEDKSVQSEATSEKKKKHAPTQDSGVSSDELDDNEESDSSVRISTKINKKGKRAATSDSSDVSEAEVQEDIETLAKRRKKEKHAEIPDFQASSSDEMHAELSPIAEEEVLLKKKKKSKSKKLKAFAVSTDEKEINSDQIDNSPKKKSKIKRLKAFTNNKDVEELNSDQANNSLKKKSKIKKLKAFTNNKDVEELNSDQVDNLPKKKSKSKKLKAISNDINDEEQLDVDQATGLLKKRSKKSRKEETSSDADSVKPKKAAVLSTKAIRFSDYLEMESKSLQSKVAAELQAAVCEKEVDGFFVSGDGFHDFLTRVPSSEPAAVQPKTNSQYDEIRAQYLKEYGAVPNRTELRRIEREGLRGSKSFHNLIVREHVDRPVSSKGERGLKQPDRLFVRKPTLDDLPAHPSWEAKKKAKQMLHVPFQGKKITFD